MSTLLFIILGILTLWILFVTIYLIVKSRVDFNFTANLETNFDKTVKDILDPIYFQ